MKDDHNQSVIFVKKKIMKNYQDIGIRNDGLSKSKKNAESEICNPKLSKLYFSKKMIWYLFILADEV